MRSIALTSVLLLMATLISGCNEEIPPERMKSGADLYNYYCKNCHMLKGPGAEMEHYSGDQAMKPYKVMLLIKFGSNTTKHSMPQFTQLSDEQAGAVADYTVSLQQMQLNKRTP